MHGGSGQRSVVSVWLAPFPATTTASTLLTRSCYGGGGIVDRTYDTNENLYIYVFSLTIFGPVYYGPPFLA